MKLWLGSRYLCNKPDSVGVYKRAVEEEVRVGSSVEARDEVHVGGVGSKHIKHDLLVGLECLFVKYVMARRI